MVCRKWHGWTLRSHADAYQSYLKNELFPRLKHELGDGGYRGFHVLRLERESEVEFVTLVWFESLDAVRSFAGENSEIPVISAKARTLLSRHDERTEHFELGASSWSEFQPTRKSGSPTE
jgi:heme-degrading monooxygenase HmoA